MIKTEMSSKPANQKRRNNEKRKEKSRVAARCRRTKEMQIFSELTAALPAKKDEVDQLDKASVMRLAISYLRARDVVSMLPKTESVQPVLKSPKGLEEVSSEVSYMNALDGFVLVLSQQGDIVYCSENIADHLGVTQMEIMGQSVFEFSHPCDHDEVREALRSNSPGRRDLMLRLKCTLTSKGRNVHLKSASYKVIHVTGHMLVPSEGKNLDDKPQADPEHEKKSNGDEEKKSLKTGSLVAVGRPIPHPSNIETLLDSKTFLTKHSLDMKFTYTDDSLMKTLGFEPEDLKGRSLYDYHHAADSASLVQQFKSLFSKGQCETGQYRFLAKTGGYAWVQTQATVITDKQQKPISIVCVNYVISGIEFKDDVFAAHQVQHTDLKPKVGASSPIPAQSPMRIGSPADLPNGTIVGTIPLEEERPIPVTELIFAPRKEDEMNKGFLTFSQDEGLTMLKDEPEDLTHLAPTAGDACIPLENSPFELFDELLNNNYCCLLNDDLGNESPVHSLPGDSLLMSSPELHESDSLSGQSSLLTDLSLDPFDTNRSDNDVEDGNSPFIPKDDLPVLEPAVMWGALPDNVSLAKPQPSETQNTSSAPALQRLLASPQTGPRPQDLITNIYSDPGLMPSRSITAWETGVKRTIPKQEDEPIVKRVKRSPSPVSASTTSPSSTSSSVLMNLLDNEQRLRQEVHPRPLPGYPVPLQTLIPQNFNSNNIVVNNNLNHNNDNRRKSPLIMKNNSMLNKKYTNIHSQIANNNIHNNNNVNSKMQGYNSMLSDNFNIINTTSIDNGLRNNSINNACSDNNKFNIVNGNVPLNNSSLHLANSNIPLTCMPINNGNIPVNKCNTFINNSNIPIPVINIIQSVPRNQVQRSNTPNYDSSRTNSPNFMSPLNISVGSPMYSLPSSPNSGYSPIMSPSHSVSPYATPQLLSPIGKYCQTYHPGSRLMSPLGGKCCDPYLTNKIQPSPNYILQPIDHLMDTSMPISSEFWNNSDMLQETSELLMALDDVKLD